MHDLTTEIKRVGLLLQQFDEDVRNRRNNS